MAEQAGNEKRNRREPYQPKLFAPREIVQLEIFLRQLRESFGLGDDWKVAEVAAVCARNRPQLGELHSFVRGMIHGL